MFKTDLSKLSNSEYRYYFNDILNYLVRKTFEPNERLMFVTYQPKELTLDFKIVAEHTHNLFGVFNYVEVLEQTYLTNNLLKSGHLIDGFHSHILMRESDYIDIKDDLKSLGVNVVGKFTYDLAGLTDGYLLKQAGVTYNRVLPTQNTPTIIKQELEQEQISKVKPTKTLILFLDRWIIFKQLVYNLIESKKKLIEALKITRWHRYIDDT